MACSAVRALPKWHIWHHQWTDNTERPIDTWAHKWRLAPRVTFDSKGAVRHEGHAQYPARLLLPPCVVAVLMLSRAHDTLLGTFVAFLCVALVVMLLSVVYCFAKVRVAALLPELAEDEVSRIAQFVMSPAFGIEALRMLLTIVFASFDVGEKFFGPAIYVATRVLPNGLTEILTLVAFLILGSRLYFSIRQLDRRRKGRIIVANALLIILALSLSYFAAGVGVFWGIYATPFEAPYS